MIIEDGTGTGRTAKIDTNNRLNTFSVTLDEDIQSTTDGTAYNFNTGNITLTDAVDTPVAYLKNTTDGNPFAISLIAAGFKDATSGAATDLNEITIVRNPTAGTIISEAKTTNVMNENRNFGSSTTFGGVFYKGETGDTFTDGDDIIQFYAGDMARFAASINLVLNKGDSIGIRVEPPASNTSMVCYAAIVGHFEV